MSVGEIVYGEPQYVGKAGIYNDQIVHTERVPRFERDYARDADGKLLWHMRGDVKVKEKMRLVPIEPIEREFVEVRLKNNVTQKVYGFREDPSVIAAKQAEAAADADLREAAILARKHGTSLVDLFRRALGVAEDEAEAGAEPKARTRKKAEA